MNPILIFKTIGISIGLTGGITGSVFSSFQAFTKIKIEDLLKDDLFTSVDSSKDEVWKLLKGKLDSSENQNEKILEETKLKDAKKPKNGAEISGNENGEKLKSWCEKIKSTKVKKFLTSNYEDILLNYVKNFCVITIGEKITSSKQFTLSDSENETLETKTNELASHKSSNDSQRGKIDDVQELKEVKTKTDGEKKRALLNWCQKTYKKTYKNSTDNLWKLADYYCKKTTIPGS